MSIKELRSGGRRRGVFGDRSLVAVELVKNYRIFRVSNRLNRAVIHSYVELVDLTL